MKLTINKNELKDSLEHILRQAGYARIQDRNTGQSSFVRRLTGNYYPRFHIYLKEESAIALLNIHLDQKKASYPGAHAHNGEYEGEVVVAELERVKDFFRTYFSGASTSGQASQEKPQNKKGFWGRLLKK